MGGRTATFAVYSRRASRILLEIYGDAMGEPARHDYWMVKGADDIWRAELKSVPAGAYYGFRCWGNNWAYSDLWTRGNSAEGFIADVDAEGNRFNPNKLLFDPYARELSHDRETPALKDVHSHHAGMYGTGPEPYRGVDNAHLPVKRREFDTGPWAPKSVLVSDKTSFGVKPRIPQKDSIIYETHLRGLTRHPSSGRLTAALGGIEGFEGVADVPPELRGTYAGAAFMAKYLKALGYTAVEFLPVHEFANDLSPDGFPGGWDRR
jgi:glycogen operon protein